ncbi:hypothetical protein AWC15_08440 [Mycobacterium lacus]|nr:hypothetical protein AWC15_08440 [Mycobacterium lacus]
MWAQVSCLRAAHRGAHAAGLGFITGRLHDAADHHRAASQRRVVTLFDGRVERIQVRVQEGGRTPHEHMLAFLPDKLRSSCIVT